MRGKSETRGPKPERNLKAEIRRQRKAGQAKRWGRKMQREECRSGGFNRDVYFYLGFGEPQFINPVAIVKRFLFT